MSEVSYINDKKVLEKKPLKYTLNIKEFSHFVIGMTLELSKHTDEDNIKKAIDVVIENIVQNYKKIEFKL